MLVGKAACHYLWGEDRMGNVHSSGKAEGSFSSAKLKWLGLHEGLVACLARWCCGGALLGRNSQVLRRRELVFCIHRTL
jgi:hypothetical protein